MLRIATFASKRLRFCSRSCGNALRVSKISILDLRTSHAASPLQSCDFAPGPRERASHTTFAIKACKFRAGAARAHFVYYCCAQKLRFGSRSSENERASHTLLCLELAALHAELRERTSFVLETCDFGRAARATFAIAQRELWERASRAPFVLKTCDFSRCFAVQTYELLRGRHSRATFALGCDFAAGGATTAKAIRHAQSPRIVHRNQDKLAHAQSSQRVRRAQDTFARRHSFDAHSAISAAELPGSKPTAKTHSHGATARAL